MRWPSRLKKGLLGLYGLGFLYCRRKWADRLEPAYLARFGVDLGDAHEADGAISAYRLMPGARRFDLGNYNFAGAAAVDKSLEMLLDMGTQTIESHVVSLTAAAGRGADGSWSGGGWCALWSTFRKHCDCRTSARRCRI